MTTGIMVNAPSITRPFVAPAGTLAKVEVLPPPQTDGMQDLLASVFKLLTESSKVRNESTQNQVKQNSVSRRIEEQKLREAVKRAEEEAEDGTIFKKITNNIGLLGVVGLATFNYSLVAADVALHASGLVKNLKLDVMDGACAVLVQSHPEILAADILLRKLEIAPDEVKETLAKLGLGTDVPGISDDDVKPVVETAVQLNLLIAGAAVSVLSAGTATALIVALAAVALSTSAFVAQKCDAPPWLVLGLSVAGAALSLGSGLASNTGASLGHADSMLRNAKAVGAGVGAANLALEGTDTVIRAVAEKAVDDANADAKEVRNQLMRLQQLLENLVEAMTEHQDSYKRASAAVEQALDTHSKSLLSTSLSLRA